MKQFFIILFFLLFIGSCDKFEKDTEVSSGTAQLRQTIFSKSCAGGSFTVSQSHANSLVTAGLESLTNGDSVSISGTVTSSPCFSGGSVSFSCEAQLLIATHRTFICRSGHIVSATTSPTAVVPTTTHTPATSPTVPTTTSVVVPTSVIPGTLPHTQRSFVSGEFHVYNNGTRSFVSIQVSGSPYLLTAGTCPASFLCQ